MKSLPPPIVFVIALGLMSLFPHLQSVAFFRPLAAALGILATLIGSLSLWAFYQAKTTIDPRRLEATSALVQHGIFRFSRNPMYLSEGIFGHCRCCHRLLAIFKFSRFCLKSECLLKNLGGIIKIIVRVYVVGFSYSLK